MQTELCKQTLTLTLTLSVRSFNFSVWVNVDIDIDSGTVGPQCEVSVCPALTFPWGLNADGTTQVDTDTDTVCPQARLHPSTASWNGSSLTCLTWTTPRPSGSPPTTETTASTPTPPYTSLCRVSTLSTEKGRSPLNRT